LRWLEICLPMGARYAGPDEVFDRESGFGVPS